MTLSRHKLQHTRSRRRSRHAIAISATAAVAAALWAPPVHAADDCSTVVHSAAEYVAALACANDAAGATTITLGSDIAFDDTHAVEYLGGGDLTIDGAGHAVSAVDEEPFNVQFLLIPADTAGATADIEITDLTVTGFGTGYPLSINNGASLTISESRFLDNGSQAGFAGTVRTTVPTTIRDSVWSGNTGIYGTVLHTQAHTRIENSTITQNSAYGTVIESFHALEISGSTFSDNLASNDYLVRQNSDAFAAHVENSTFVGNTSATGTIRIYGAGTGSIWHSTFAHNTSSSEAVDIVASSPTTLTGTAVVNDSDLPSCTVTHIGSFESSYTYDADGSCTDDWAGTGNFGEGIDPLLGGLANNGGPTSTLLPADGSPLIDAIPVAAGSALVVDQRGIERPQGDGYDIGAVEVQVIVEDDEDEHHDDGDNEDQTPAGLVEFEVHTDSGIIHGTASAAIAVTAINWTSTANLTGAPANTALPYGAAGFTVEVPEPGDSVTITLTAPTPFTSAYKVSGDDWTKIDGATFSADGTTVTYTLTDGGELDEDGQANGLIVDPVALAVQATFTG